MCMLLLIHALGLANPTLLVQDATETRCDTGLICPNSIIICILRWYTNKTKYILNNITLQHKTTTRFDISWYSQHMAHATEMRYSTLMRNFLFYGDEIQYLIICDT